MLYRRIVVAFDGSQGAWKALRRAILLAKESGAEITVLSIEAHLPHFAGTIDEVQEEKEEENQYFAKVQGEAVALAQEHGVAIKTAIRPGHAAQEIVRYAREQGCDLVVTGHAGHSGVWGVLLGSTADRVVDHAPCDVLVVR